MKEVHPGILVGDQEDYEAVAACDDLEGWYIVQACKMPCMFLAVPIIIVMVLAAIALAVFIVVALIVFTARCLEFSCGLFGL